MGYLLYRLGCSRSDCGRQPAQCGAFGWGGAFGTLSWTDPAEKLTGVIMLQQPYGPAQYDFENAVRQAIID